MMPTPYLDATCVRCERVFSLAVAVGEDWICDDCLDRDAEQAVAHEMARYHGGGGGRSQRERQEYAKDTGRRR